MTITIYTYVCIHVYMYRKTRGQNRKGERKRRMLEQEIKIEDTRGGGGTSAL